MIRLLLIITLLFTHSSHAYDFAAEVIDLKTGKAYTVGDQTTYRMFASSQKIFTVFTALEMLGADFQFETQVLTNGSIDHGHLSKDLIIKFDGNPDLTLQHIDYIAKKLLSLGINSIDGDIIFDISIFDNKQYPDGWSIENQNFCYSAPVSPIIINKNCVPLTIASDNGVIRATSSSAFVKLESHIEQGIKNDLHLQYDAHNEYHIRGTAESNINEEFKIAIRDPALFAEAALRAALAKSNISHNIFQYSYNAVPAHIKLFSIYSRPLLAITNEIMVQSNNLMTEILVKRIGALYGKGTTRNGVIAITAHLNAALPNGFDGQLADGSGLSRKNLLQINALSSLLVHHVLFSSYDARDVLFANGLLPLPSKDHIFIKTGLIDGVSAIAGYITDDMNIPTHTIVAVINGATNNDNSKVLLLSSVSQILKQWLDLAI